MGKTQRKVRDQTGPFEGSYRRKKGLKGRRGEVCKKPKRRKKNV